MGLITDVADTFRIGNKLKGKHKQHFLELPGPSNWCDGFYRRISIGKNIRVSTWERIIEYPMAIPCWQLSKQHRALHCSLF